MSKDNKREPKPVASNVKPYVLKGDFAAGERTRPPATEGPDFARGIRTLPASTAVGDFASGEHTLPTSTTVGDFASGEHTLPSAPENQAAAQTMPPVPLDHKA